MSLAKQELAQYSDAVNQIRIQIIQLQNRNKEKYKKDRADLIKVFENLYQELDAAASVFDMDEEELNPQQIHKAIAKFQSNVKHAIDELNEELEEYEEGKQIKALKENLSEVNDAVDDVVSAFNRAAAEQSKPKGKKQTRLAPETAQPAPIDFNDRVIKASGLKEFENSVDELLEIMFISSMRENSLEKYPKFDKAHKAALTQFKNSQRTAEDLQQYQESMINALKDLNDVYTVLPELKKLRKSSFLRYEIPTKAAQQYNEPSSAGASSSSRAAPSKTKEDYNKIALKVWEQRKDPEHLEDTLYGNGIQNLTELAKKDPKIAIKFFTSTLLNQFKASELAEIYYEHRTDPEFIIRLQAPGTSYPNSETIPPISFIVLMSKQDGTAEAVSKIIKSSTALQYFLFLELSQKEAKRPAASRYDDIKINPYEVLGVKQDAPQEDIRKAYKQMAFKFHPDKNPNNKEAEEKMKDITLAYEIVGDADNRKEWDRVHQPASNRPK